MFFKNSTFLWYNIITIKAAKVAGYLKDDSLTQ
jgi:hypothetical protein